MTKPKPKSQAAAPSTSTSSPFAQWSGWKLDLLSFVGLYAAMAIIFYPLFYLGQTLSLSNDSLAANAMSRAAAIVSKTSDLPLWNPYLFCGTPLFSAYHFGLFVNPIWYLVRPIGFLFGGEAAIMFFYMLFGAIGVYMVIRELGEQRGLAFVSALAWLWLPALVVLPDVGHGSKMMSSDMLPWLLWASIRVSRRDGLQHVGILALLTGLSLLSLHTQIAYYGFMMVGWIAAWEFGTAAIRDKKWQRGLAIAGKIALASAIGVGISMVLSLPVLKFASASSRGAAGGGVDWEYATSWSFHPLETITFLWPTFFGFGGATYWGYMPFTDMPLTFGIVALVGAVLAVWMKRDRLTWMLLMLAILAWAVSWGKFLPVLYKPFFEFLPMFKKFRVPSLIIILTQLAGIVLAARGFGAVFRLALDRNKKWEPIFRKVAIAGVIVLVAFFLLSMMMSTGLKDSYVKTVSPKNPQVAIEQFKMAADEMWNIAFNGGIRTFILLAALAGLLYWLVKGTIKPPVFIAGAIIAVAIDFLPMIYNSQRPLVTFNDASEVENYFAPTGRIKFLQSQPGLFRVLPNDKSHTINWWSSFGIQSASGYSGVKLANWDKFEKTEAMGNPAAWRALNIKYFATDRAIRSPLLNEVARDENGFLYEILGALPRAYFTRELVSVSNSDAAFEKMATPGWEPSITAFVEGTPPPHSYDSLAQATVTDWSSNRIVVKTHRTTPGVLTLAEIEAPHWQVTVNGKPEKGVIVDGLMRGVAVPAGDVVVEWTYQEATIFYRGLWLTIGSLLIAVALIVVGVLFGRKKQMEAA